MWKDNENTRVREETEATFLVFSLGGVEEYGLNSWKVQEVILPLPIRFLPRAKSWVRGMAVTRDKKTVTVVDLVHYLTGQPLEHAAHMVLVEAPEPFALIVHRAYEILHAPWGALQPAGIPVPSFVVGVLEAEGRRVLVVDPERIWGLLVEGEKPLAAAKGPSQSPSQGKAAKKTVLVVDDSSFARDRVAMAIGRLGMGARLAASGEEALSWLESQAVSGPPEQICPYALVDLEMPGMDGFALTKAMVSDPRLARVKVIWMSAIAPNTHEESVPPNVVGSIAKASDEDLTTDLQVVFASLEKGIAQSPSG